jgi:CBS domain-containing protein
MKASDIMTPGVISADPDATVLQAARYMLQHHISGLPIIDKTGNLVGILSEGSILLSSFKSASRCAAGINS